MTQEKIDAIIAESIASGMDDNMQRRLLDAKHELQQLIVLCESFVQDNILINDAFIKDLRTAKHCVKSDHIDDIVNINNILTEHSMKYVEQKMDNILEHTIDNKL